MQRIWTTWISYGLSEQWNSRVLLPVAVYLCLWISLFLPGYWASTGVRATLEITFVSVWFFPLAVAPWLKVRIVAVLLMWCTGLLQAGYYFLLGAPIDSYLLLTLQTTDAAEVKEFFGSVGVDALAKTGTWALCSLFAGWILIKARIRGHVFAIWGGCSILLAGMVVALLFSRVQPYQVFLKNVGGVYPFTFLEAINSHSSQATKFRLGRPNHQVPIAVPMAETIVIVLGESSSRERWQLFGYGRPTTPRLVEQTGLIAFSGVTANANFTAATVPVLITGKSLEVLDPVDPTIIDLARGAGFHTTVISNQNHHSAAEDPFSIMLHRADRYVQAGRAADDSLITPHLDDALRRAGKKLILLHTYGSHPSVARRTPASKKPFEDEYDNSISYTDLLLAQWISLVERRAQGGPAMLAYISDHGLSLGAEGGSLYVHGNTPSAYQVPMLIWASGEVWKAHKCRFAQGVANAATAFSNTVFFSTLSEALGYPASAETAFSRNSFEQLKREVVDPLGRCMLTNH
jgi:glucan phosphoethanolaminetransferase (alkaline phosphatase superfamily)